MPALAGPAAAGLNLSLDIGSIEHPALTARGVKLDIGDRATLSIANLDLAGRRFTDVRAECGRFSWQDGKADCRDGRLSIPGLKEKLPFGFSYAGGALDVDIRPTRDERWHLVRRPDGSLRLEVAGGRIERLAALLPMPEPWNRATGKLDGKLLLTGGSLQGGLRLAQGAFSDAAGLQAGEKIDVDSTVTAKRQGTAWNWRAAVVWRAGEVFWQPVYAKADGQALHLEGSLDGRKLKIGSARLIVPGTGEISGAGEWERSSRKLLSGHLESAGIDLGGVAQNWLAPILAGQGLPELELRGRLSFALGWDAGGLAVASLGLNDVALRDRGGRFAAEGISGGLPWLRDGEGQGYLAVGSARAGDFQLGAFRLPIDVQPRRFAVARSAIPLLGSELVVERLVWRKSAKRQAWEGDLSLTLNPVSLPDLTRAFGLPAMAGTLSASFPHLRYREGAAYLDGALVIQVFDGYLNCTHLRLEEPFGSLPRLTADVEARHIDLGQLTETFSFGRIEGFADGDIRGLELVGWKPQRFDARVASSPGQYRKRISQRAVQNISSLGGAGAGAALQASVLRLFEEFGYDRIGLSCRLENGVCDMGGVEDTAKGYVIVKGGGIPALTVIGYNRRVDWSELVDRLLGVIHNNVRPVIR
ncbi:MAG TPA: hypothetical protein VJ576_16455 [Rhodocyclaceae bacterium]|nr:hypothetical protein [Rhodocyclaceae bacterium]